MKTHDFDTAFDNGESVMGHLDMASASRPNLTPKRVNVDFPQWMVTRLDHEAGRRGVSRQALIKLWLADKLETV